MQFNPETTAFVFPGQGSQTIGMGRELAQNYPIARQTYEEADNLFSVSLSKIAWEGPEDLLNDTINTQPALMVHSIAALRVFHELFPAFQPFCVAGHSMGELSALVAAEALPYREALFLVRRRGELMKRAGEVSPGGMAAILGLDIPTLDDICAKASRPAEVVQVANDNSPGQVVISGASAALQRAVDLAQTAKARRVIPLAVSIAAHSPLMLNAQQDFNRAVASAPIQPPRRALVGNVTAKPLITAGQVREDLQAQLTSRVRWTETIQWMATQGMTTIFEIGNNSVLSGLVKRINRDMQTITLGSPADFEQLAGLLAS
jgi:[acyl-carrier-protein] S-malonyltransferase